MTTKTPNREEAERTAIAFLESAVYKDTEFDHVLVSLIRKGCIVFKAPDLFEITELGMETVEDNLHG